MDRARKEGMLFFASLVYFAHFMNRALGKLFLGWVRCGVAGLRGEGAGALSSSTMILFNFFFIFGGLLVGGKFGSICSGGV